MSAEVSHLKITTGLVMLYYCFDAGYEIQISQLEKIRGKTARQSLLSYTWLTPPYIRYKVPPLLLRLGKRRISNDGYEFPMSIDIDIILILIEVFR